MTTTTVLAEHVDTPTRRHRCVLLDATRLRCLDCDRTLVLPTSAGSTSTSRTPPRTGEPQCPEHSGEHADACRCCRAEQIEDRTPLPDWRPTADVVASVAAARRVLAERRKPTERTSA